MSWFGVYVFSNPAQKLEVPTYVMQMPTLLGRIIEIEF